MVKPENIVIEKIIYPIDDFECIYTIVTNVGTFRLQLMHFEVSIYKNQTGYDYKKAVAHLLGRKLEEAVNTKRLTG